MTSLSGISIETFRGDLEGLERMAHTSWRDEYGVSSFPNLYRPAFLKYLFDRIEDKRHLIAAYKGDEIVAFLANLPQRFSFRGNILRAVYSCLLVTRKEFLRRGLAQALINEALRVNKYFHYDFAILTLEKGHRSSQLIKKLEGTGCPVRWIKRMNVIARILDLERVEASEGIKAWERAAIKLIGGHGPPKPHPKISLREYRPSDLEACLSLLNKYRETVGLALVWDKKELEWELDYPDVSQTLVFDASGKVEGLINFIFYDHIGKTTERWAWVNHVAYPGLSSRERAGFVQAFLHYVKAAGCAGAIEWTKNYYPVGPFYRARFFPYFRSVNMLSWGLSSDVVIRDIPDVYQVQI